MKNTIFEIYHIRLRLFISYKQFKVMNPPGPNRTPNNPTNYQEK